MIADSNEFTHVDRVAVVPLDDVSKLLMPFPVISNRVGVHDLGVVCQAVAGALLCSVWDLVVYQVPRVALDFDLFAGVYAVFRSSSPGEHLFIGYYGIEVLKEESIERFTTNVLITKNSMINLNRHMEITIDQFLVDCCHLRNNALTLRSIVFKYFQLWVTNYEDAETKEMITERVLTEKLMLKGIGCGGNNGMYYIGLVVTEEE
jgi:hypothetical protein